MVMILLRVLLLVALIWLIWAGWRRLAGRGEPPAPKRVENMVKCVECGEHIPEKLAHTRDGQYFCQRHGDARGD